MQLVIAMDYFVCAREISCTAINLTYMLVDQHCSVPDTYVTM